MPGEPITVTVDISVAWGAKLPETAERVRAAIHRELSSNTELTIAAVHTTVQDVRFTRGGPAAEGTQP